MNRRVPPARQNSDLLLTAAAWAGMAFLPLPLLLVCFLVMAGVIPESCSGPGCPPCNYKGTLALAVLIAFCCFQRLFRQIAAAERSTKKAVASITAPLCLLLWWYVALLAGCM